MLARGLGPEGIGRYSAALVDVNLLVALLSFGLPGALAILSSETVGKSSKQRLQALRRIARARGVLVIGILGILLLAVAAGVRFAARPPLWCLLIGVGVVVQYGRDVQNSLLWGQQRFWTQNYLNLLVQLVLCAGLCALIYWGKGRLATESAFLLQVIGNLLFALFAALGFRLLLTSSPSDAGAEIEVSQSFLNRRAWNIGGRNYLSLLIDLLLLRIDVYLIQELAPQATREHDLGLYQAGVRVAELLLMLPGTLNTLLFAKAAAQKDTAAVAEATLHSAKLAVWIGCIAFLGMAAVGQPLLVWFFGSRFGGSFVPCLWVLLGCVAMCFSSPLAGTLQGAGAYPRSVVWAQGVALLVNVAANLYLIPRQGIIGAAAASALAYTVSAILIAAAFARRFAIPLFQLVRPQSPFALWRSLRRS